MERLISKILGMAAATVAAWAFTACSTDENSISTRQGYISIHPVGDATFAMPDGSKYTLEQKDIPLMDDLSLTLTSGPYSHTWDKLAQFGASQQSYMAGEYTARLSGRASEAAPDFAGESTFMLQPDEHAEVEVSVRPADALLKLSRSGRAVEALTLFSEKYGYMDVAGADTVAFLKPGVTRFYARVADGGGRSVVLALPAQTETHAAAGTTMSVEADASTLSYALNCSAGSMALTPELFDGKVPTATPQGFTPGETLSVVEGLTLSAPVVMNGQAGSLPIAHAWVSCSSEAFSDTVAPSLSLDLLNMSAEMEEFVRNVGFEYSVSADHRRVEAKFNNMIEKLASLTTAKSCFSLMLVDQAGRCSEPLVLNVNTRVMTLDVAETTAAVTGIDQATIVLNAGHTAAEEADFAVHAAGPDGRYTVDCPILKWNTRSNGGEQIAITVQLPEGSADVPVAVSYLGMQRAETVIKRVNPQVTYSLDPFATTAIIWFTDIKGLTDTELRAQALSRIANQVRFTVDGVPASVWLRDPDSGAVIINGLTPDRNYKITGMLSGTEPLIEMSVSTEKAEGVPSGNFTDWKTVIDYKGLPCGGRFSATTAPVVNRQNYTDVRVDWPKEHWANENAKTFYKGSARHNSWYMQPTAWIESLEGLDNKAICVRSAAWDHNGPAIADYVQQPGNVLDYSNVAPRVAHKSAGRFWLGSYGYNAETDAETIEQGVPFTTRPSGLNGYFKYLPDLTDASDYGVAKLELVARRADGTEVTIATASVTFRTSPDYKAFNMPLDYKTYNLKPTHLKLMFLSSHHGLDGDDADVPVTALPAYGRMTGSALWIQNLTFSY